MRALWLPMVLLIAAQAQAAERPLIEKGSEIRFRFSQMNVPAEGRFKHFSGKIDFDPAQPQAAQVSLQVPVASFDFGPEVDAEVAKPEWLNSAKFPVADFESRTVKALGGDRYEAAGSLTIKGVTHDVTVPFQYRGLAADRAEVAGEFAIQRADYGVGGGEWGGFDVVANEVQIRFKLQLGPAPKRSR